MYLQICGISIFASKSLTTIFILKQTHSKHTYKGIEREFWSDWQIQNILSHIYIIYFKFGIHLYSYAPTCIRSRCKDQPRWERALPYLRHAAEGLDWFIWQWIIRLSRSWYRTKYLRSKFHCVYQPVFKELSLFCINYFNLLMYKCHCFHIHKDLINEKLN